MLRHRPAVLAAFVGALLVQSLTAAENPPVPGADQSTSSVPLPAATPSAESAATAPEETTERIEVTGSHIKRIDVEGVSPVETITRKQLETSGYNSVADVMRDTSANSFGSKRERSGSNAAGAAEVDLRGLGASNTLVLLNGQRLPSDAVTGAVDLNLIPMAAIERVEILKDGASAIYGSDALGGVVNIITRKDFTGSEVSATQTIPQSKGGERTEVGLVNGVNSEKLNVVSVLTFRNNGKLYSRDRPWSDHNMSSIGDPGSYKNSGGLWNADPNCPGGRVVTSPSGSVCSYRTSDTSTEMPSLRQLSLMSEANYSLNSDVKLTARVGGTQR
jgi:iron complex outermembrane receptor protein